MEDYEFQSTDLSHSNQIYLFRWDSQLYTLPKVVPKIANKQNSSLKINRLEMQKSFRFKE